MRIPLNYSRVIFVALLGLLTGKSALAQVPDLTWETVGSGNWTGSNWTDGVTGSLAWADAANAIFGNAGGGTITKDAILNTGTVTFNGDGSWEITGAGSLATGSLVKSGLGSLTLTTANSYAGGTTVNGGWLRLGNDQAAGTGKLTFADGTRLSSVGTSALTLNNDLAWTTRIYLGDAVDSGRLTLRGNINLAGTRYINTASDVELAGVITGDGSNFWKEGSGTLYLTGNSNVNNSRFIFTGGVVNFSSIANIRFASSLGSRTSEGAGSVGLMFRGGTLQYTGATAQTTNRSIRISTLDAAGSGTNAILDASGSNPYATLNFTAGSSADLFENTGSRSITFTGSNTGNNTFNIALTNQNTGAGNLTSVNKTGSGTWVLTGANTYSGTTNVNEGTLVLGGAGTMASTAVIVMPGATFRVAGTGKTLNTIAALGGSTLGFVANNGATTTITNDLTLIEGEINIAATLGAGVISGGSYDLVSAKSILMENATLKLDLSLYGDSRIQANLAVEGTKLVMHVTQTLGSLVWNNSAGTGVWNTRGDVSFANTETSSSDTFYDSDRVTFDDTYLSGQNKTVTLAGDIRASVITVNNNAGDYLFDAATPGGGRLTGWGELVKTGSGKLTLGANAAYEMTGGIRVAGGTLDLGGKTIRTAVESIFRLESGSTLTNGVLQAGRFTVNAGTIESSVILADFGYGVLNDVIKETTGTVFLKGTSNSYTGVTYMKAGILNVASLGNYGQDSAIGNRSASQDGYQFIGILFDGGTLQYTGSTAQTTNRAIRIGTRGATIDASGTNPSATVNFAANSSPDLYMSAGTRNLTLTGTNTGDNTFNISLTDHSSGATSLTKTGTGTWVLTGTHTNAGATLVNEGTLRINGSLANSQVTVATPATLGGTGTIGAATEIKGRLAPGNNGIGTLTFASNVTISGAGSAFRVDLGTAGTSDRIHLIGVDNFLSLDSANTILEGSFTGTEADLTNHEKYWIATTDGTGTISGTFANSGLYDWTLLLGATAMNGYKVTLGGYDFGVFYNADFATGAYTGGNDLLLVAIGAANVPEPSRCLLLVVAACCALTRRRRTPKSA